MFITFEGVEGAGKTTAIEAVARHLTACGEKVCRTREPGGCPLGQKLRSLLLSTETSLDPLAELHLFLADRAQHVAEVIRPALADGAVVLCDRFTDSTLAYQGFARHLDVHMLHTLNMSATGGLEPDLTLVLDLPVQEGLRRVAERRRQTGYAGEGRIDDEQLSFHEAVRKGFLFIAEQAPSRVCLVDASLSREEVLSACLEAIEAHRPCQGLVQ